MLRIIDGQIGAGKTFYAVDHVLRKYFKWSSESDEWVSRELDIPVHVVTNIADCRLGESFDEAVEAAGSVEAFFNVDQYQRGFCEGRHVIYIIDEAQALFHRKYFDAAVFYFFQYHRHLGVDVYLITQDVSTLSPELRNLAEYYIHAARRTHSLVGEFRYQFKSGPKEKPWNTTTRKPDPRVFAAYQSMVMREAEKSPNAARRMAAIICFFLVCTVATFVWFARSFRTPAGASGVESVVLVSPGASAAVAAAWAAWAVSYVRSLDVVSPASSVGVVDPVARGPGELVSNLAATWVEDGRAVVRSVYGPGEDELRYELERGDGTLIRLEAAELTTRCRCWPGRLVVGAEVVLGRVTGTVATAMLPSWRRSGARDERSGAGAVAGIGMPVAPFPGVVQSR